MIMQRQAEDVTIVDVGANLIMSDGPAALREEVDSLLQQGRKKIVLNLSGCRYIDSVGISTLIGANTKTSSCGGYLKLVKVGKSLRALLENTKSLDVFEIYDDEQTAIASFK